MPKSIADKEIIIDNFSKQIELSDAPHSEWKIGIASLERASRSNINMQFCYMFCDINTAKEIQFHFICLGVSTCDKSKSDFHGIYLYR